MSVPAWLKVAGLVVVVIASMFVGALVLPSTGNGDSPSGRAPEGTPTPASHLTALDRDDEPREPITTALDSLADLVDEVRPSVVVIEWLNDQAQTATRQASGSGFVVDTDGHVMTNYHVIEGQSRAKVTLADGTAAIAEVIGQDPGNDLAVLRVDLPAELLVPVRWGDSESMRPGDPIFTIGSPFTQKFTVTSGIISATGRTTISAFTQRSIRDVIQIDAAVNPGNSGGPLFNMAGEVIGVNTSIENPNGRFFVGIGFAVPSNTAQRHLPAMIEGREVIHGQLGVEVTTVDAVVAEQRGLAATRGVLVTNVTPGSAADRAGIVPTAGGRGGDIIVRLGGDEIRSFEDLSRAIDRHNVGDRLEVVVNRGGEEITLTAELQPWEVR